MTQAYISRPSGNCSATRRAPSCRTRATVLWICLPHRQRWEHCGAGYCCCGAMHTQQLCSANLEVVVRRQQGDGLIERLIVQDVVRHLQYSEILLTLRTFKHPTPVRMPHAV